MAELEPPEDERHKRLSLGSMDKGVILPTKILIWGLQMAVTAIARN